jgi:methyl-accepting chemotaxis protein
MKLKSLTKKVLILSGVLFVSLTGYGVYYVDVAKPKIAEAQRVEKVVPLIREVTEVVQVLQKERGRSAGYIGSEGKQFGNQLKEQWKETDKVLQKFSVFIRSYNFDVLPPMVKEKIMEAVTIYLPQIQSVRQKVWNLEIPLQEELNYYTSIINSLIDATMSLAKGQQSGVITRDIASYGTLTLAKEKEGLERAVLSVAFANKKFPNPDLYNFFVSLVAKEKSYLRVFNNISDEEIIAYYNNTVKGAPVIKVDEWVNLALKQPFSGKLDVDPNLWFKTITEKIDLLHKVELYILDKTDKDARKFEEEIKEEVYVTTGALIFVLLFSLLMSYSIYKDVIEIIKEKEREI